MAKKDSRKRLFEVMERVAPNFNNNESDIDWGKIAKEKYGLQNWDTLSDNDKNHVIEQMKQSMAHQEFIKQEFGLEEQQVAPVTGAPIQQQQYSDRTYQPIAPALKLVNTPEKFAPAFRGWFQYLGYSPQQGNISIQRVRMDVEAILKQMGYK